MSMILFVLTIVGQLIFSSCRKPYPACDVENPIKELPWLVDLIDGFERDAKKGYLINAKIYQSTYNDGTCFILELCIDCYDGGYLITNCEGETLCSVGGYADGADCVQYNINFDNKKLIWKSK